jgi:hypothetical protein
MQSCPLCTVNDRITIIKGAGNKTFHLCGNCKLIFVDPLFHLSKEEGEARYRLHQNDIQHKGYVDFLNMAINPAVKYLQPEMKGLDYGCGPNPTLSLLLEKAGFCCENYDPIFYPKIATSATYDYVFSTECFEHFFFPEKDIASISNLLNKSGLLIIMTLFWKKSDEFEKWYYAKDPTHVSFYHKETFQYVCNRFGFKELWTDDERVIILQKTR